MSGGSFEALPALRPGEKWYIVKKGDNGFWDVAEKCYGSGKGYHWPLIQNANPKADRSDLLMPGQKLRIPPLSTAVSSRS